MIRLKHRRNSQSGISLTEVLIAGFVLVLCSVGVLTLITTAIASNNRNKHDSTKTMLAEAVIEQVNSILIGGATAQLTDCKGNTFSLSAAAGGAKLQGSGTHPNDTLGADIDFTESSPPSSYHMNYVVTAPCSQTGAFVATYDVRWHIDQVGTSGGTPSNSFLITVGSKQNNSNAAGQLSGLFYSQPVSMREVIGRAE